MKKIAMILLIFPALSVFGQENPTRQAQPIVEEGKRLFKSEMASWYGTDLFLELYKDRENIGGYFSYSEGEKATCIFYSRGAQPRVIGTIIFDSTYNTKTANSNLEERDFTANETDIYQIRKLALESIRSDTMFKTFKNTGLNIIPLIEAGEKKVYVLTGPKEAGIVIFGNDYLLTFDKDNNLTGKKQLHKNIMWINTREKTKDGEKPVGAMHIHLPETGDFITATDVCTLMLYENSSGWESHVVYSEKYMNIWNCKTNQLTVVPGPGKKNPEQPKVKDQN
jgi:hypothetical protein